LNSVSFWAFFAFGTVTVLIAVGGGLAVLVTQRGSTNVLLSYLLIFLGASLAVMLGSLLVIRSKERKKI